MKVKAKRGLAAFLATIMAISCLGSGVSLKSYAAEIATEEVLQESMEYSSADEVTVMEETSDEQYAIYPIPQNVVYGEGELMLTSSVVVVAEEDVDAATLNYVKEVLTAYEISYETAENPVEGKTNILLGTRGSEGVVEQYVSGNDLQPAGVEMISEDIWEQPDAHIVDVKDNRIVIYGSDTDSVFHGSSNNSKIRSAPASAITIELNCWATWEIGILKLFANCKKDANAPKVKPPKP